MIAHGVVCIIWAERVAIQREMNVQVGWGLVGSGREEAAQQQRDVIPLSVIGAPAQEYETHVLFDDEDDDVPSAPPTMDSSKTSFTRKVKS